MKKLLTLLAATALITACNLPPQDFDLDKVVHAEVGPGATQLCTVERRTINLSEEAAYNDAKDYIKSVELLHGQVSIVNPDTSDEATTPAENVVVHGTVRVTGTEANGELIQAATYQSLPVEANSSLEFQLTPAAKAAIEAHVKAGSAFDVEAEICVSDKPAYFDMRVQLTLRVTPGL